MKEFMNTVWKMIVESNILNIIGALLILLAGWVIALLCRKIFYSGLKRMQLNRRLSLCLPEEDPGTERLNVEKLLAGVLFWFLFLLTILAALTSLRLSEAAAPIRTFLNDVSAYLPSLIAGICLIVVAWIVATALKYVSLTAMAAFRLDERVEEHVDTKGEECKLSYSIATILYWLVYLCFAPAVLSALKIDGITQPIQAMLNKVFVYIPHLVAACAIAFFGLFCAGLLRRITVKFIENFHVNVFAPKKGETQVFEQKNMAQLLGIVVYAIIAIPVVIAALSALKIESLTSSVSSLFDKILAAAGNIFGAMLLLLGGYIAGKFVARLVVQLLESFNFDQLFVKLGFVSEGHEHELTPSHVVGQLSLFGVMLFCVIGALELLQLTEVAGLLRSFIPFAGRIIVAIAVFLFGVYLANLSASIVRSKGFESALFGFGLRVVILFFAGAVALHTADIGGPIVQTAFTLILGALAVAAAIAFGIGGKDIAAKKLKEWTEKDDSEK